MSNQDDDRSPAPDERAVRGLPSARRKSQDLLDRMSSEVGDPETHARFRAAHDGMSPIEYALSKFPSVAKEIGKAVPHLAPKPKAPEGD